MQAISVLHRVTGLFVLLLALLLIGGSNNVPSVVAQQRTCYRQQDVITPLDDACNGGWCQDWRNAYNFGRQADGSITFSPKVPYGHGVTGDWRVWVDQAKAELLPTEKNATVQYGWTIPPQMWCSDQNIKLTVSVAASGDSVEGHIKYLSNQSLFQDPPVLDIASGGTSHGYVPSQTGSITAHPPDNSDGFDSYVHFMESVHGEFEVHYRYTRIPAGQPTPGRPPITNAPPTPGGGQTGGGGATNTTLPMPPYGQPGPSTNTPGMALQAAQRHVGVGELVLVPVWLINGNNVANINYELTYNASVARPEGTIQKGNLLDNALFSVNPNTSGIIRVGFAQTTGVSGTGTVTNIPFRATGKVGDRTALNLAVTTINNPAGTVLAIDRIPGEIVIVGPGEVVPGDCAGDGGPLTMFDAMCALQMSVQLIPVRLVMDMDQSGDVTSRDAAIIAQKYTGLIP